MKKVMAVALLGAALIGTAAWAAEAMIGTWTLNVGKSTFNGPAMKSQTRVYAESANGFTVTTKTVDSGGKEHNTSATIAYDGKPHPVSGGDSYDSVIVKSVDAHTGDATLWKDGKQVGTLHRVVSLDGKTLTITTKLQDSHGKVAEEIAVYDRGQADALKEHKASEPGPH
jgi:hypothetical protein